MPPTARSPGTTQARTTTDLILHAEDLGVRVHWSRTIPERGRCYVDRDVIVLRHGMSERRTVSTLAHELAHHWYGDTTTTDRTERRAWRWAGRLLVPCDEYAQAELEHPSPGAIAQHLGVTTEIIHALQAA